MNPPTPLRTLIPPSALLPLKECFPLGQGVPLIV